MDPVGVPSSSFLDVEIVNPGMKNQMQVNFYAAEMPYRSGKYAVGSWSAQAILPNGVVQSINGGSTSDQVKLQASYVPPAERVMIKTVGQLRTWYMIEALYVGTGDEVPANPERLFRLKADWPVTLTDINTRAKKLAVVFVSDGRKNLIPFVSLRFLSPRGRQIAASFQGIDGIESDGYLVSPVGDMKIEVNMQEGQRVELELWALP